MKVSVLFRGPLAKQLENPIFEVTLEEGTNLRELFETLLERDESVREVWKDPDHIDRDALVMCNDVDIGLTGGLETVLSDGDNLTILPLVHGG